jgi:predicted nucleotide-binding protein (sugar kinase/HSP70/actin superfamily)
VSNAIDILKARARREETVTLVEAVTMIGIVGPATTNEAKMSRAAMLDVIEEREGEQFVTDLLDAIEV